MLQPNGEQIPLQELASIEYTEGPAKISETTRTEELWLELMWKQRLAKVVTDIQKIVNTEIKLPSGYYVQYGGQFENLQSKSQINAVPLALFLILILLYFAFGSIKEALMVYSAIPLSAVGGVLFLWMRGLPLVFPGVGFIALWYCGSQRNRID
jgi:cobalt-zinc-cadmium resistance protein CzcA